MQAWKRTGSYVLNENHPLILVSLPLQARVEA